LLKKFQFLKRELLILFLIGLIVEGFIGFVVNINVFGQPLITLKWRKNAGTGSTWMGPLAADLNNDGLMEIVITGSLGIAALDPINGNVIWSQPYGGDHVPFEIIDLNKDNIPEILLCPQYVNGTSGQYGVLALHGNNGSVYWYNPTAAGKGTYIAVADINADGYPEIYSAYPGKVTALTYDGTIFASTYTYYTCWGGLSIGDTDFDGVFEVYLGERSSAYPPPSSPGRGLRAFWADNLTERWSYPDILCSSQTPVLADVDKDGDLEIIILNQVPSGVAVINTDGSVNTYNGIYRKSAVSDLETHSNPPVADLDGDGNLELITCGTHRKEYTPPQIWDLVDWKLDATLPFECNQPPGVADIDGDGKLEIIAPNQRNVTIFKYNPVTKNYDIIYTIPLSSAHPFSIAQDIDADGKLELVFNQQNHWISVYDVETPVLTPKPRSGLYFYSEYRTRVPVYVPPPDQAPKIAEISPNDGATGVSVTLSQLNFKLTDYQNDLMNYTVATNPYIGSASGINVPNGEIIIPVSGGLARSTTYTWTVTATDGTYTTTRTFTFYTEGNVSLNISTVGNGSVIKNPDNEIYAYGTPVQLTAVTDDVVNTFSHWEGDLEWMGNNNPATILMNGNKSVTAVFTKKEYTLRTYVSPTEGGSINVNKTAPYYYGDVVELTAVPNSGWSFSHWSRDLNGSQNPATIIMDSNKRVTAVFTQNQYTLDITIIGNGTVTKNPDKAVYANGENVTLTATPDLGWIFAGWSGDVSSNENPITITMNGNKSITAIFTQKQYYTLTIITIGNGTVNKDPDYAVYSDGENVTLTAIPDVGWQFVEWSGDISSSENPTSILIDGNKTVYVAFTQINYTLTINKEGEGNVTIIPDQEAYTYGTQIQLIANPENGWSFSHWSDDIPSSDNPLTFTITSNMTITAHFTQNQYAITIIINGSGQVIKTPNQTTYVYGDTVELNATADLGWIFSHWEGDLTATDNPVTIIITGNMSITAHFTRKNFTITASVTGTGGTIQPSGKVAVPYGQDQTFTITPDSGYHIQDVIVDGSSVGPVSLYTFYAVDSNHTITATFAINEYVLILNIIGNGSVTKSPDKTSYTHGETVELTAVPDSNWTFSGWDGDLSGLTNPITITMTENKTVTATFTLNTWWNHEWKYRRTITINHTKINGTLTNFPLLIEIVESSLIGKTQPNGYDFVFTDANNVKLNHQIEFYNSTIGHLIAWVNVPYLSSTEDTKLYMYYGNPNCDNQQNPTAVWDTNYKLVLHLNENTGIHYDSTMNGNDGTPVDSLVQGVTGAIGNCVEFNGGYIELPRVCTSEVQFTFSAWIYARSGARYFICEWWPLQGAFLQIFADSRVELYVNDIRIYRPITLNQWYYVVGTFDGATARLYINAGSPASASASTPIWPSNNTYIGDNSDHVRKFVGFIDEIRVSNIARSAAWILAEYNNQLNPTTFYSLGAEETFQETYVLTVQVDGNGSVAITPEKTAYDQGENVTLTATPEDGYSFQGWSGDLTGTDNPAYITMTKNMSITAHFTLKEYTINASVSGTGGTIEPSGLIVVYHGQNITFTITADTSYHILEVLVDDESQGAISTYTFYAVDMNHTITAIFAPDE